MEQPINAKPRKEAIIRFAIVCFVSLILVCCFVFVTRSVIQVELKNNASLVAPAAETK